MKIDYEIEYNNIIKDIITNKMFLKLENERHHGITRLEHLLNVSKIVFLWSKKIKLKNIEDITRGALLHDFFTNEELNGRNELIHPYIAVKNADKYFTISNLQKDIIISHMFPLSKCVPKHKESWLVSFADKYCALKECIKYKMPLVTGTILVYTLNIFMIQK